MILVFLMLSFKPDFSLFSFILFTDKERLLLFFDCSRLSLCWESPWNANTTSYICFLGQAWWPFLIPPYTHLLWKVPDPKCLTHKRRKWKGKRKTEEIFRRHACVLSCFSCVWFFATPQTVARQAPLSMGFSRQEYWSGLPCPPPGDLPDPGIKLTSLATASGFFPAEPPGKAPIPLANS